MIYFWSLWQLYKFSFFFLVCLQILKRKRKLRELWLMGTQLMMYHYRYLSAFLIFVSLWFHVQYSRSRALPLSHVNLCQTRYLDIWETSILAIKRDGYSIKCIGPRGGVVTEKFQQNTTVWFVQLCIWLLLYSSLSTNFVSFLSTRYL